MVQLRMVSREQEPRCPQYDALSLFTPSRIGATETLLPCGMASIKASEKRPLEQDGESTDNVHSAKKSRTDSDGMVGDSPLIGSSLEQPPGSNTIHPEVDNVEFEDNEQNDQGREGQQKTNRPEPKKGKSRRFRANPKKAKEEAEASKNGEQKDYRRGSRTGDASGDAPSSSGPRLPKRAVALLLGACGTGFSGMQLYVLYLLASEVVFIF